VTKLMMISSYRQTRIKMKKSLIPIVVILVFILSFCGNRNTGTPDISGAKSSASGTAIITFNEYNHEFGKVTEGEKVACIFTFTNSGSNSLVVSSVTTSCGCTAPKYDTKPIEPGEKGNVEVVFNASGMNGKQTKTVTVKSNASVPVVLLRISAEVVSTVN
jgi:hypothetical protein